MTDSAPVSARRRFRALLERTAEEHPELSAPEIAELISQSLPADDPELVDDYLYEEAHAILALMVRASFAANRQGIYTTIDVANPDAQPLAARSEKVKTTLSRRVEQWREYVPTLNQARPLLDMTHDELLASAQYDAGHVFIRGWKMRLKEKLAADVPADGTTVGDHYTNEEVLDIAETIKKEMTRGNFRLSIKTLHALSGGDRLQGQVDGWNTARSKDDRRLDQGKGRH